MPRPDLQMKNKNKLKRKLNKTSKNDEEENTLVFTPGLIEEVLSQILSHLSISQLKSVRFVSHLWNQEASKHLGKRGTVEFNFFTPGLSHDKPHFSFYKNKFPHPISRLSQYANCRQNKMRENQNSNPFETSYSYSYSKAVITLCDPSTRHEKDCCCRFCQDDNSSSDSDDEIQENLDIFHNNSTFTALANNLTTFFSPENANHSFTSLKLDGELCKHRHILGQSQGRLFSLRTLILSHISSNLVHFEWGGWWGSDHFYKLPHDSFILNPSELDESFSFPPDLVFPHLKTFTLSMESRTTGLHDDVKDWSWFQALFSAVRGVKQITFKAQFTSQIMLAGLTLIQKDQEFRKLEQISTKLPGLGGTEILQFLANQEGGPLFPLSRLEMHQCVTETEDIALLQKILWKYWKSIEFLKINLPTSNTTRGEEKWIFMLPPILPRLTLLEIDFWLGCETGKVVFGEELETKEIIDYEKRLPRLQSLVLRDPYLNLAEAWDKFEPWFSLFLPKMEKNDKICKSLRNLELPWMSDEMIKSGELQKIADFFPNVHNSWMNQIRSPKQQESPPVLHPTPLTKLQQLLQTLRNFSSRLFPVKNTKL